MSAIFGVVDRSNSPLAEGVLDTLRLETSQWGSGVETVVSDGNCGLGLALSRNTPEAAFDHLPLIDSSGVMFTAAGRVDNRSELAAALGLETTGLSRVADGALIYRAWLHWGDSCPERIFGDWAFAIWNPGTRTLFLARDHSGNTAIYYHANPGFFVFSSSRRALLKLNLPASAMDEMYLAQVLVTWTGYSAEQTIHKQIQRLPPAHHLTVTSSRIDVRKYWHPENTPELLLRRNDYVPAFLEIFDRAVADRLRGDGPFGSTLSGGLDSGSVAVTAARHLRKDGRRLTAFSYSPIFGTDAYTGSFFGDELPFARATAEAAGNIDLAKVDAAGSCPIDSIRRMLEISMEPKIGACNHFWTLELRRMAAERGCHVLLTGQAGNHGISWAGGIFAHSPLIQIRGLGWGGWLRQIIIRHLPQKIWRSLRRYKIAQQWWHETPIHPDFADRLDLISRCMDELGNRKAMSSRMPRCPGTNPGGPSFVGASEAEVGAAFGLDTRDPTGDPRVLAFCYSVPDGIFIDPATGIDRWLIREAMKGRLPESVRMNRRRGQQAADLVPRLRNSAAAVDGALAEIEAGPAAEYISVAKMRTAWETVRKDDTPEALMLAVNVVTKGIMGGLFVNGFGTRW